MINANRNLGAYESFGVPVWPDALPDYAGPLAGFLAGLERCETPYLVTVPCDTPRFPVDLVERLAAALESSRAEHRDGRHARRRRARRSTGVLPDEAALMESLVALHCRRAAQDRPLDRAASRCRGRAFDDARPSSTPTRWTSSQQLQRRWR